MKIAITQSNYIPWKGYFDSIAYVDLIILYDDAQYTRRDWRNRNYIKTPSGLKWLTIPVEVKGKYHQKINETLISDPNWTEIHWKTLLQNYSRSPEFKVFADRLKNLYETSQSPFLSEINFTFITTICQWMDINTSIRHSSEFRLVNGKSERLVDLCQQVGATDYFSGPAAKAYIDVNLFDEAGIKIHYWDYSGYPEYPQMHGSFEHNVSILDLFLNTGSQYKQYLKFCNHE
jgi:hypothetical protein